MVPALGAAPVAADWTKGLIMDEGQQASTDVMALEAPTGAAPAGDVSSAQQAGGLDITHFGEPVYVFEGEAVTEMEGRLPAVTFEMPKGYPRGTIIRVVSEWRVRNVRYEENRHGDLVRQHILAVQSIELAGSYNPAFVNDVVGGPLAAGSPEDLAAAAGEEPPIPEVLTHEVLTHEVNDIVAPF